MTVKHLYVITNMSSKISYDGISLKEMEMLRYIKYLLSEEYGNFLRPYREGMSQALASWGVEMRMAIADRGEESADGEERAWFWKETEGDDKGEQTLFLTDIPEVFRSLSEKGFYAAALCHGGNHYGDFPEARYLLEEAETMEYREYDGFFRRLAGLPWDILTTDRCLVRETTVEDVDAFYRIYSQPSITAYMDNLYQEEEQEKAYVREYIDKIYGFYGFGIWTVLKRDTGEVIGRAGLSYRDGFEDPELGFVIGVPWQGQGFAHEVCSAILSYGSEHLGFGRVQALVEPGNEASLKLCEKLGMQQDDKITLNEKTYVRMIINLRENM